MPTKRPFGVTLLLWLVLSLSAWNAIRLVAAVRWWNVLREFDSSLSPVYLSITGAGWVVAGGVLLSGILSRKSWARPAIITSIVLWLLEYWMERFFQSSRANLLFALTCSVVVLVIAWIAANHESTKSFFSRSEAHEQSDESSTTE